MERKGRKTLHTVNSTKSLASDMPGNPNPCYRVIKVPGDKGMGAVAAQDLRAGHSIIRDLPFRMSTTYSSQ